MHPAVQIEGRCASNPTIERWKRYGVWMMIFICMPSIIHALRFSEDYIGLGTEYTKFSITEFSGWESFAKDYELNLHAVYGPAMTHPVRFRGGIGTIGFQQVKGLAGVEVVLFELLGDAMAKRFGVYGVAEGQIGIDYADLRAKIEVFLGFSPLGGLQIAVGYSFQRQWIVSLSYSAGLYPLQ